MSLTDDTNTQTFDIPLPDETDCSLGSNVIQSLNSDNCQTNHTQTNSWTQPQPPLDPSLATNNVNNCVVTQQTQQTQPSSAVMANPYDVSSLQQSYQNYYSYYSSAYQQMPHHLPQMNPQLIPQRYPFFMPQFPMRPIVPVVPQMPSVGALQRPTVSNANNNRKTETNNSFEDNNWDDDEDSEDSDPTVARRPVTKASNVLPIHCNEKMGLNPLLYTNVQNSPYFKNNLFQLKTYHEVIDEIYFSVKHLEPWEKGSRKVGGQTGMCGSVRGVGAGGIISTPFCILFKLFTLRLTRKQVNGLIRHKDSPFIRALGFMYIRFTQPPQHLFNWFEPFLDDEEEVDPKAGGGQPMTIGQMCRHMLSKLDWFSTLFPRVPVPIQKDIESKLRNRDEQYEQQMREERGVEEGEVEDDYEEPVEPVVEEPEVRRGGSRGRNERRRSTERERRHSRDRKRSHSRDKDRRSRDREDSKGSRNSKHKHRRSDTRSPQSPHSNRHNRTDRSEHNRQHRHRH